MLANILGALEDILTVNLRGLPQHKARAGRIDGTALGGCCDAENGEAIAQAQGGYAVAGSAGCFGSALSKKGGQTGT
jgi:hypothetical protein